MPPAKPIPHCYWVEEGRFLAGEYPRDWQESSSRQKLQAILDAGTTAFVDLTEEGELSPYAGMVRELAGDRVQHRRFPIRDVSVPTSDETTARALDCIDEELAKAGTVYLHCLGGRGRTGTILGCWLVRHGLSGTDALKKVHELWQDNPNSQWSESPETDEQRGYVLNWMENADGLV